MLLTLLFIALLGGAYIHPTTPLNSQEKFSATLENNDFLHKKEAQWNDTTTITGDNYSAQTIIMQLDSNDNANNQSAERVLTWYVKQIQHIENQYISADYTTMFFGSMYWFKDINGGIEKRNAYQQWAQIIEVETFTQNAQAYNVEMLTTINTNLYGTLTQNNQDTPIQLTWDNTDNTANDSLGIEIGNSIQTAGYIEDLKTSQDPDTIEDAYGNIVAIGDEIRLRFTPSYNIQTNSVEMTGTAAKGDAREFNKQNFFWRTQIQRHNFALVNRNTKESLTDEMWDDPSILNNITWSAQMYNKNTMRVNLAVQYIPTEGGEVIDIGGLMFDIIGMPFTFISQAFDVTLFPGTQYQLNIGNLIKGLIAILTVLFIVKLFTKGIDVLGNYTGSIQDASHKREQRQHDRQLRHDAKHGVKEKDVYSNNE